MSELEINLQKAKRALEIQRYFSSLDRVIYWDYFAALPPDGMPYMGQVSNFLREESRWHLFSDETKAAVNFFRDYDLSKLEDDYQRTAIKGLILSVDEISKFPDDLINDMGRIASEHQMVWQECKKKSDWQTLKPYVKKAFDIYSRFASIADPDRPTYEVLISQSGDGTTLSKLEEQFSELRDGILDILPSARKKYENTDLSPLEIRPPQDVWHALTRKCALAVGFDFKKGTMGERMNPYCGLVGPADSRPTTNYNDFSFPLSCIAIMHECGHGMYNYGSNDKAIEWSLWGGIGGAFHEAQSRFTQNMIGKSRELWVKLYPEFQTEVPELRKYDLDTFYRALTCVRPGCSAGDADELTYGLHMIIRFELERDYFEGKIGIDDLEEQWNRKYEEYLGVRPQNASEGILQEMHWSIGLAGYYQNYTLGDLYAAQMRHQMIKDVPDAYERLCQGDPQAIIGWMQENIWQYGTVYSPEEIMIRATGEPLKAKYLVEYLRSKYGN